MLRRRVLQPLTKAASISRFSTSTINPNTKLPYSSVSQRQRRVSLKNLFSYSSSSTSPKSISNNGFVARYLTTHIASRKEAIDGCDLEHWSVVLDAPDPSLSREEIIDIYIKTLAQVLGSEDEARKQMYTVSTKYHFAFGCTVSEELAYMIKKLPKVKWVIPDSYVEIGKKFYGGEPFIDKKALPYDPKYHEDWVSRESQMHKQDSNGLGTPQSLSNQVYQDTGIQPPILNLDSKLATETKQEAEEHDHPFNSDATNTENSELQKERQAATSRLPKDKQNVNELDLSVQTNALCSAMEKAKATTMELMERVGTLSRQTKKYQDEAEGLRAEKCKDEEIVLALRKERDHLFKEIERLATELKDAHNSNEELVMEKILLEEENGKIIVNMEAVNKDVKEKIDQSVSEMQSFVEQLEKAKTELSGETVKQFGMEDGNKENNA
ncbi:hypothetical protein IFM89_003966 [Coptis chinensis]|uniref:MORF/ORRM1/DAG-like MORF domain-containing protein n=1 Tax=Coptis chinensis TaxID=261450 RepID=A0A835H685_9MAGN|nr:hypothetical protein IFM89_003966 [Coptis chinensis]